MQSEKIRKVRPVGESPRSSRESRSYRVINFRDLGSAPARATSLGLSNSSANCT